MTEITQTIECSLDYIEKSPDRCDFIIKNCSELGNFINFADFYYCKIDENFAIFLILLLFVSAFCFHLLSSTTEKYLAPAITKITQLLRLSEVVAGVTLLAFANGAPDIITSFTAGGEEKEGIALVIGSIFGAGLFVLTVVLARVITCGEGIQAVSFALQRDIIFYILATLLIFVYGIFGEVNIFTAMLFPVLYIIFVIFVIVQDKIMKKRGGYADGLAGLDSCNQATNDALIKEDEEEKNSVELTRINSGGVGCFSGQIEESREDLEEKQELVDSKNLKNKVEQKYFRMKYLMRKHYYHKNKEWEKLTWYQKAFIIYEFPLNLIRDLTIPIPADSMWSKPRAMLHCVTAPLFFILFTQNIQNYLMLAIMLPIGGLLALLVWFFSDSSKSPSFIPLFSIGSLIISTLYIYFFASILLDYMNILGMITGISSTYLGLTLIAWGNSINDYFTNPSLARMGLGVMAVSGCFGGQVLNLMLGFGSALVRQTIEAGDIKFNLLDTSNLVSVVILIMVLFNLFVILIYANINHWKLSINFSYFLGFSYVICFIVLTIVLCLF